MRVRMEDEGMKIYLKILLMVFLGTAMFSSIVIIMCLFIFSKATFVNIIHLVILFILSFTSEIYLSLSGLKEGK